MDNRILVGAASTALVVVVGVFVGRIAVIFAAGFVGGVMVGIRMFEVPDGRSEPGPVGTGARAAAIGGACGFLAFVVVGTLQSLVSGDLSVPAVLGFQTILVAVLVVPLQAVLGAIGGSVGVRLRGLTTGHIP